MLNHRLTYYKENMLFKIITKSNQLQFTTRPRAIKSNQKLFTYVVDVTLLNDKNNYCNQPGKRASIATQNKKTTVKKKLVILRLSGIANSNKYVHKIIITPNATIETQITELTQFI